MHIGGDFIVLECSGLQTISGFDKLQSVDGPTGVQLVHNPNVASISGFGALEDVAGSLAIATMPSLTAVPALPLLREVDALARRGAGLRPGVDRRPRVAGAPRREHPEPRRPLREPKNHRRRARLRAARGPRVDKRLRAARARVRGLREHRDPRRRRHHRKPLPAPRDDHGRRLRRGGDRFADGRADPVRRLGVVAQEERPVQGLRLGRQAPAGAVRGPRRGEVPLGLRVRRDVPPVRRRIRPLRRRPVVLPLRRRVARKRRGGRSFSRSAAGPLLFAGATSLRVPLAGTTASGSATRAPPSAARCRTTTARSCRTRAPTRAARARRPRRRPSAATAPTASRSPT